MRPIWSADASRDVVDSADTNNPTRLLGGSGSETICRIAEPTYSHGRPQSAPALPVARLDGRTDPRWRRAFPWASERGHTIPILYLALAGFAALNCGLPLAVIWLATRKHFWSLRLLLAIPAAVAVPLTVYVTIQRLLPPQSLPPAFRSLPFLPFVAMALAGLPQLGFVVVLVWTIAERRWRRLAILGGLTVNTAVAVGGYWLWSDSLTMAPVESNSWSAWHNLFWPATYATGLVILIGCLLIAGVRKIVRAGRHMIARSARAKKSLRAEATPICLRDGGVGCYDVI